jgi:hypothetical protein
MVMIILEKWLFVIILIYYENDNEVELFFPSVNGIYDKKIK